MHSSNKYHQSEQMGHSGKKPKTKEKNVFLPLYHVRRTDIFIDRVVAGATAHSHGPFGGAMCVCVCVVRPQNADKNRLIPHA